MIKIKQVEDLAVSIQKAEQNAKVYTDERFSVIDEELNADVQDEDINIILNIVKGE